MELLCARIVELRQNSPKDYITSGHIIHAWAVRQFKGTTFMAWKIDLAGGEFDAVQAALYGVPITGAEDGSSTGARQCPLDDIAVAKTSKWLSDPKSVYI